MNEIHPNASKNALEATERFYCLESLLNIWYYSGMKTPKEARP